MGASLREASKGFLDFLFCDFQAYRYLLGGVWHQYAYTKGKIEEHYTVWGRMAYHPSQPHVAHMRTEVFLSPFSMGASDRNKSTIICVAGDCLETQEMKRIGRALGMTMHDFGGEEGIQATLTIDVCKQALDLPGQKRIILVGFANSGSLQYALQDTAQGDTSLFYLTSIDRPTGMLFQRPRILKFMDELGVKASEYQLALAAYSLGGRAKVMAQGLDVMFADHIFQQQQYMTSQE